MKKLSIFISTFLLLGMTSFSIVNAQENGGEENPGTATFEVTTKTRNADRFCLFGGTKCVIQKTKMKEK